jgi:hypothetical protein
MCENQNERPCVAAIITVDRQVRIDVRQIQLKDCQCLSSNVPRPHSQSPQTTTPSAQDLPAPGHYPAIGGDQLPVLPPS